MSKIPANKSRKRCRDCGVERAWGVEISLRGLCESCRVKRMVLVNMQLIAREGEHYEKWLAAMRKRKWHPIRDQPATDSQSGGAAGT